MLDLLLVHKNVWKPPVLSETKVLLDLANELPDDFGPGDGYLYIDRIEPYIDAIYVEYSHAGNIASMQKYRFVFFPGYIWDYMDEAFFVQKVLNNNRIRYTCIIDEIFKYYSMEYPDWKLQRYYTKSMRLLDHIYHCMRKGTAKELLYKAGLDELAAHICDIDELNLLAKKPSEIYDGVPNRVLRSLNCREGSLLLSSMDDREFIKTLNLKSPEIFKDKMNDAQCKYLKHLIDGNMTVGEVSRLFTARKKDLLVLWASQQYQMFIHKEKMNQDAIKDAELIAQIDPIYKRYVKQLNLSDICLIHEELQRLIYYLLRYRNDFDRRFRRSNRRRKETWQERNKGYVVRYPQTVNDFCRESIYMSNCMMTYMDAYLENDTTILFMRRADDVNAPFITIEVFENELKQAYHRFNEDCTPEEAEWILEYCDRHNISRGTFQFDIELDELF